MRPFARAFARAFVLLVMLFPAAGCHSGPRPRVTVAVSVFPLYDLVRRIAGPDADVLLVLPPGASPQGWNPPPDVVARVGKASLLVSVGLGLDPWMDALLPSAAPKARALRLGDRVPTISSDDGTIDGYVWMDPQRAQLMATAIAEDLARADSSHAIAFRSRAATLDGALAALDKEIDARTARWTKRDAGTLPTSLAYFGERYGIHARIVPAGAELLDPFGGTSAAVETYEGLIRANTAALEPRFQ